MSVSKGDLHPHLKNNFVWFKELQVQPETTSCLEMRWKSGGNIQMFTPPIHMCKTTFRLLGVMGGLVLALVLVLGDSSRSF